MVNTTAIVLSSAVRAATTNSSTFTNYDSRGGHFVIDVTAVPGGGDTVTPKIEGADPASGKYYDILVGVPIAATGTSVLKVHPDIAASLNTQAKDVLPTTWRVTLTHSANTNFTYSVGSLLVG